MTTVAKRKASNRCARNRKISYKEASSSTDSAEDSDGSSAAYARPSLTKIRNARLPRRQISSKGAQSKSLHDRPLLKTLPRYVQQTHSEDTSCAWAELPYEILFSIFQHASYPLCDKSFTANPRRAWHLNAVRTCKAFARPALAAFYERPPIVAREEVHQLLDLLKEDPGTHFINYRTKIKRLELDARRMLAYKTPGRGYFDIASIIPYLPNLSAVHIWAENDRSPFREVTRNVHWVYPRSLFLAFEDRAIRLQSWSWNQVMLGDLPLEDVHVTAAVLYLRRLSLSHLEEEDAACAIAALPQLQDLKIVSCKIQHWAFFFSNLVIQLSQLRIISCPTLSSKELKTFLGKQGSQLKSLILHHNRSLDLRFLPDLKASCPSLEVLRMNLTYHDPSILGRRLGTVYDVLLTAAEMPTWPLTLQTLELLHLSKWSPEAAETLFASLISSARQLRHLRVLKIKAILDMGWRDRAGFREKWIGNLQRVFLNRSPDPNPELTCLSASIISKNTVLDAAMVPAHQQIHQEHYDHLSLTHLEYVPTEGFRRKSQRIRKSYQENIPEKCADTDHENKAQLESRVIYKESEENDHEAQVQGLCHTVEIDISNLRPVEMPFNEGDFLDSEMSGDEDYEA